MSYIGFIQQLELAFGRKSKEVAYAWDLIEFEFEVMKSIANGLIIGSVGEEG